MLVNIYWPLFISRKKWEKLRTLSKNENVNKKEKNNNNTFKICERWDSKKIVNNIIVIDDDLDHFWVEAVQFS